MAIGKQAKKNPCSPTPPVICLRRTPNRPRFTSISLLCRLSYGRLTKVRNTSKTPNCIFGHSRYSSSSVKKSSPFSNRSVLRIQGGQTHFSFIQPVAVTNGVRKRRRRRRGKRWKRRSGFCQRSVKSQIAAIKAPIRREKEEWSGGLSKGKKNSDVSEIGKWCWRLSGRLRANCHCEGDLSLIGGFRSFPLLQEKKKKKFYVGVEKEVGVWNVYVDHFSSLLVCWIRKVEDRLRIRREGRYGAWRVCSSEAWRLFVLFSGFSCCFERLLLQRWCERRSDHYDRCYKGCIDEVDVLGVI